MKQGLLKKMSISTLANLFEIVVSLITTLAFPKVLSEITYSYWQIYVFYIGFVTIAGFGLVEGIYLLNGGKNYSSLDKRRQSFFSYWIFGFTTFIFLLVYALSNFFINDSQLLFIILFVCIEGVIFNIREYPLYVLQATDRIKEFSIGIVIDRLFFIFALIMFFILGKNSLMYLMISDIFGHICCAIYSYWKCKDMLLCKPCGLKEGLTYVKSSMRVGINLMVANMISVLIIGVIKYGIQFNWSVLEFGKISLVITCTNLFMKLATSISMAIFPTLCNYDEQQLKNVYNPLNYLIERVVLFAMVFYYPVRLILSEYLPNYAESFAYMGYLLPICLFQIKVSLIYNTYYKALRKEKILMSVNVITLILSVILTIISAFILDNLLLCVLSILIVLAFRSFILERVLSNKIFEQKLKFVGIFGMAMSIVFVIANGVIGGWLGALIYLIIILLLLFIERRKFLDIFKNIILKINRV